MWQKIVKFIFFGNYFVGILAIALSVESCMQLQLPLNSFLYYLLLFCATVMYYTYAYTGALNISASPNARTVWYKKNDAFVKKSQLFFLVLSIILTIIFITKNKEGILSMPLHHWLLLVIMAIAGLLYYGLLPKSFFNIKLRNTGWLKAFIIGFVWACCANLLPFIVLRIEKGFYHVDITLLMWLFVKNWMFCTVNAIMFDIKDYADDSNLQLKTFVVRFGLRNTIYFILVPLMIIGLLSFIIFAYIRNLNTSVFFFNLLPFLGLLALALSMQKPHKILYYLIVIDGLVFFKALCGIAGMQLIK